MSQIGRHAEALGDFDRAVELAGGETKLPASFLYNMACLNCNLPKAALKEMNHGEDGSRDIQSVQYQNRALTFLKMAHDSGFFKIPGMVQHMKDDPDLASLRARPEFWLLIMDIEFPADPFGPAK